MAEQTSIASTPADTSTTQVVASAGPFTIPWPFAGLDDVVVTVTSTAGVLTHMVRGVDYAITATVNDDGMYPSGTFLFTLPQSGVIRRYRDTEAARTSQLPLTGYLSRSALNADLNRAMMALIDLKSEIDRGVQLGDLRGTWASGAVYYTRDIVKDGAAGASTQNYYIAREDHTAGVWATDLAAVKWELLLDVGTLVTSLGTVTLNGNNPFTGNNTHSGTEGFSGIVTMTSKPINHAKGADLASASTTDIGAATGNYVVITGTTTITALGTIQAGTMRFVRFSGALILTHNATSLILPGAANITTIAGDTAIFVSEGSGNWRCLDYRRALSNNILVQQASTINGAVATGTTVVAGSDTLMTITTGNEYMTLSFTPKSATSTLVIEVVWNGTSSIAPGQLVVGLFQDAVANALASVTVQHPSAGFVTNTKFSHVMVAGTTSAITFRVRAGANSAGTTTFNGTGGLRYGGGIMSSSIIVREYL